MGKGREGKGRRKDSTAFEVDGVQTEEDFVVWHYVGAFFDRRVRAFGVPCAEDCVIVLCVIR